MSPGTRSETTANASAATVGRGASGTLSIRVLLQACAWASTTPGDRCDGLLSAGFTDRDLLVEMHCQALQTNT